MDLSFLVMDLRAKLAHENSQKEQALQRIQQLEQEAEAAELLSEACEEAVHVLEEELAKARLRELSAASGESEEYVKDMIAKLKRLEVEESNLQEEKMKLQTDLSESLERSENLANELHQVRNDGRMLSVQLEDSRQERNQMDAQISDLWSQYSAEQQNLQKQLADVVFHLEKEKSTNQELELANLDKDDDIGRLEQLAADLETKAISERNRAAKLEAENKGLNVEYERLQSMLMMDTPNGQVQQVLFSLNRLLKHLRDLLSCPPNTLSDVRNNYAILDQLVVKCLLEVEPWIEDRLPESPESGENPQSTPVKSALNHNLKPNRHIHNGVSRIARRPL